MNRPQSASAVSGSVGDATGAKFHCLICDYRTDHPNPTELGQARGNTERFKTTIYPLWKCPSCQAIHSVEKVELEDIYRDYPLNRQRRLDVFARGTLKNLLRRLTGNGLEKNSTILDFGCGNGVFLEYLRGEGYTTAAGYDPYVAESEELPLMDGGYDCVVANDVIEHVENPRTTTQECFDLVKPGGLLYLGTADSEGVKKMDDLEPHIMRLHQPFHRVIVTQQSLLDLGNELGLYVVQAYKRSYMDTLIPFANYRFLDEFNKALGHNLDLALAPDAGRILLRRPSLLFYALFGYFVPSADEPAVLWRKPR
ncbi:class I SAM-dependent methyltransferase [Gammaproteobacteria bacterium]|nr:class I SAM-dependent methyltransferase [Gammaproteobacteria bacterium]